MAANHCAQLRVGEGIEQSQVETVVQAPDVGETGFALGQVCHRILTKREINRLNP